MRLFVLIPALILLIGAIALLLIEFTFQEDKGPDKDHGDPHGMTSGRPRVIGYIIVGIVGFFAMLLELAIIYSGR